MINKIDTVSKNIRYPVVAGQFYPANKEQLVQSIEKAIAHNLGTKVLNKKYEKRNKKMPIASKNTIACIAPHAGYVYSGPCQSHAYNQLILKESKKVTYIIIGLSHHGFESCLCNQNFMTPLGTVENNIELLEVIQKQTNIPLNNKAHQFEHSIEVQLPFLQYYNDKYKNKYSFVPLIIGQEKYEDIEQLVEKLASTIIEFQQKTKEKVKIIVSSDFTHYGKDYNYTPKINNTQSSQETINIIDKTAIQYIVEKNSKQLFQYYTKTKATICGIYPILFLLKLLDKLYPNAKGSLESYYTSQQIIPSISESSVSYAAITFKIED